MSKKQTIIRDIQNEDYIMKKENEQNEEREILDKTSLALRKYLDVNLVPILSEGIVKILKDFPEDPVDKLAEFLFENSLKVPNPDPSTFEFWSSRIIYDQYIIISYISEKIFRNPFLRVFRLIHRCFKYLKILCQVLIQLQNCCDVPTPITVVWRWPYCY